MNIWSRLGVSVAFAAIFSIAATETLQTKSFYEVYKWYLCVAFLSAGPVAWIIGRSLNARRARKETPLTESQRHEGYAEEEEGNSSGRFMLFDLAYWGPMLIVFGVIICFITPMPGGHVEWVNARTPATKIVPKPAIPTNATADIKAPAVTNQPVVFPPLRLQGLTSGLLRRCAMINGRTYYVGDFVGKAKVISINRQRVMLELDGQTKTLTLGQ
jgi:hypothetical protein